MNNEKILREIFTDWYCKNYKFTGSMEKVRAAREGFQACWQLFMPHIEILEDDYEIQSHDTVIYGSDGVLRIRYDGKPCIKAKDLMGE